MPVLKARSLRVAQTRNTDVIAVPSQNRKSEIKSAAKTAAMAQPA